ncbi:MAG TPA: PhnD/SsuA/transferrin family substrate-binding protein [Ktedonobacteraceae bacterium]
MHIMFSHKASVIRFATFLAPQLYRTYEHIASYVGGKVGYPADLTVGRSFEDFGAGRVDAGFICGLPYVRLADAPASTVEILAAPVLQGERYRQKPVYFSDVIVRSDSPYSCFDDLSGCTWAYNEATSHSGYNLVCSSLLERGKTLDYFGTMVKTGSHQRSLQSVLERRADAAAIDSHVLDVVLEQNKDLAMQLRVVTMLGPSSIPPMVIARSLDPELKCRMREALLTMHDDPDMARVLHEGRIDHFVAVTDDSYNDIRTIFARTQVATIEG